MNCTMPIEHDIDCFCSSECYEAWYAGEAMINEIITKSKGKEECQ